MTQQLNDVFHALADPTRRAMLRSLALQELSVGELAEPYAISLAAASKHIKVLERAELVQRSVQGRTHVCRLNAQTMREGLEWMRFYERFWNDKLDTLELLLRAEDARTKAKQPNRNPASKPAKTRNKP